MKATGIVRRFDDLGRIVIPKELRKQLFGTPEKSEGMLMEIFTAKDEDEDVIILRKYEENKADDVCEWKQDKGCVGLGAYNISCCGKTLEMPVSTARGLKYCPYCSKKIKVVE